MSEEILTPEQDPEYIFIEPECCSSEEGRQWCHEDVFDCCDNDVKATRYIRADLYEAIRAALEAEREQGKAKDARIAELEADPARKVPSTAVNELIRVNRVIAGERDQALSDLAAARQRAEEAEQLKQYYSAQENESAALIAKIQDVVDSVFPESRWADHDVLDQGVGMIANLLRDSAVALHASQAREQKMREALVKLAEFKSGDVRLIDLLGFGHLVSLPNQPKAETPGEAK